MFSLSKESFPDLASYLLHALLPLPLTKAEYWSEATNFFAFRLCANFVRLHISRTHLPSLFPSPFFSLQTRDVASSSVSRTVSHSSQLYSPCLLTSAFPRKGFTPLDSLNLRFPPPFTLSRHSSSSPPLPDPCYSTPLSERCPLLSSLRINSISNLCNSLRVN